MQLPGAIVMVRPTAFGFNPETASTNSFQRENSGITRREIERRARAEFDILSGRLRKAGVDVIIFEDTEEPRKIDAVFPNNWISFHHDGSVVLYPMFSSIRRPERRRDIIERLQSAGFDVRRVIDLSHHEKEERFLEGTGSIVFDYIHRCAYANTSPRTNPEVLKEVCGILGYDTITFRAVDRNGKDIYHTNVMMSIGDRFAILCMDSMPDPSERRNVFEALKATGREIITIDFKQLENFAGNVLQVKTKDGGSVLAMSTAALLAFRRDQRERIEKYTQIVEAPLPLIESIEGGSARCMIAGVHLPRRKNEEDAPD